MARSILEASIARKIAGVPAPKGSGAIDQSIASRPRKVSCYHCGKQFEISPHARTGACAKCCKRVCLDDLVVRQTTAPLDPETTLSTCGLLVVEASASCDLRRIEAMDGVEVGGRLHATISSKGPIVVDASGELSGEVDAPAIVIKPGAIAAAYFRTGRFAEENRKTA